MSAHAVSSSADHLDRLVASIAQRLTRHGVKDHLKLVLPSGRVIEFGQTCRKSAGEIQLKSYKTIWASLRRGSLGLCESYVDGHWESPDVGRVFSFFLANGASIDHAAKFTSLGRSLDRIWHWRRGNTRTGSKRNIEAHYDLGNEFYGLWLDGTMTYSAAWFGGGAQTLETAQMAKNQIVLDALETSNGHDLLEIGCGWGGLAEAAADRGANVTGITLSEEQLAFSRKRLGAKADLRLQDYRDVEGSFDRIASIEMIEAVGEAYWPRYFRTLSDRLRPGGIAVIQAITIDPPLFPLYRRSVDFIQRHIFPGGMLPTPEIIKYEAEAAGLAYHPVLNFGLDYAHTLSIWRDRFEAAWPSIAALGFDETFRRKWRVYLAYCEAGFRAQTINVGLYQLVKPANP